jgi:hypothetical protein
MAVSLRSRQRSTAEPVDRIGLTVTSPSSWERCFAHAVHIPLYGLILTFPLTGLLETMCRGDAVQFFGQTIPAFCRPNLQLSSGMTTLNDKILPLVFLRYYLRASRRRAETPFGQGRIGDVRRILR